MIDIERCKRGMEQIDVKGVHVGAPGRLALIEEAIARIQRDPAALSKEYLGIKNYAGFGDQREDHKYGYGPKHGTVVFSVGRSSAYMHQSLDDDAIYYLECERDFEAWDEERRYDGSGSKYRQYYNLAATIREADRATARHNMLQHRLAAVQVEAHV